MLNFYSLLPKPESVASTSMPAALLWSKETETATFAFSLFAFGKIGFLPKSSRALDYLPIVDCTLVKYPLRT
jgi:hypothetical protein